MDTVTGPVQQRKPSAQRRRGAPGRAPVPSLPHQQERSAGNDPVTAVLAALLRVARFMPDLRDALRPGIGRSTTNPVPRRRGGPTGGQAPVRIAVLDAIADIESGVIGLHQMLCERLGTGRPPETSLPDRLRHLSVLLLSCGDRLLRQDPDLIEHAVHESARLAGRGARALDGREPVHRLPARCPVCRALSLRCLPDRGLVICVNAACRCDVPGCGCRRPAPRRHRWDTGEWGALAELVGLPVPAPHAGTNR